MKVIILVLTLVTLSFSYSFNSFAFSANKQLALSQSCEAFSDILQKVNSVNCTNDDRIVVYFHLCKGDTIQGYTVTDDSTTAYAQVCSSLLNSSDVSTPSIPVVAAKVKKEPIPDDPIIDGIKSLRPITKTVFSITVRSIGYIIRLIIKVWLILFVSIGIIISLILFTYWLGGGK